MSGSVDAAATQTPAMSTAVHIKYGSSKVLVVNPNAGLAGTMDYIRSTLRGSSGLADKDHVELCDEGGKLINPRDFPPMMLLSSFLKPGADEAFFIPFRVDRDANRAVLKVEALLNDADKLEPEVMQKLKKENHVPREKKPPRGESATVRHAHISNHEEAIAAGSNNSAHSKRDGKKLNIPKAAK
ncbi:hypothetical protein BV898_09963 [Hypsibius exemplaris]|uniref:Uncharacterized protein n=1 Tax=Hypsibius exemplaris TaxID=2072580 RepID=A0A1W0WL28_HYPEX|nr:hypothetical protein BV898_09963 [Hypsibius exemplaris]